MQISANNLLIAGQQARAAQPATPPVQPFEPLPLKKVAADAPAAQSGSPVQRPGSQLDIHV